ncbi:MAG: ribosome maturation factor RimP [Rhodospirillaceae bacterium]|nr:ribosome maturation factor RimP [Rhodospirillaceae bacterium]
MTTQKDMAAEIEAMIAPSLDAMGYSLVRVLVAGGRRPTLQIMAERGDERPMTTDDCAEISRAVSALLDVEDPFPGPYTLEVSSPGLDRPLTRAADYVRFAGSAAKLETRLPIDGRKRFKGRLLGLDGDTVRLSTEEGEAAIPLGEIVRAKLMITEDLLAADRRRQRQTEKL